MTSQRHRIRRVLAIAASACVGLTGALVFAAPASAHQTNVNGSAECDVVTGEWVIDWTVENSEDDLVGEITDVKLFVDGEETSADQLSTIVEKASLPIEGDGKLTEQMRVSGDTEKVKLKVWARWDRDGHKKTSKDKHEVKIGGTCAEIMEFTSDCESLTVSVSNPAEEPDAAHVEATVTVGEETEELSVAPGETGEATFDAEDGTVATVTIGNDTTEVAWEEPANCDEGGGEGGGDEELPETGAPIGLIAGGAVLLLALGGGLYALARRRRYSFTA